MFHNSFVYDLRKTSILLTGVGGVSSGADAYEKIKAGARVVQLYTAFVYEGPFVVEKIKTELAELLSNDNFKSVTEAIGRDAVGE